MFFKSFTVGDFATNCYLIADEKTKQAAIIDAGGEIELVIKCIEKNYLNPVFLLLTHGHIDHIFCNAELKELYRLQMCIYEDDASKLLSEEENLSLFLGLGFISPKEDRQLKHNDILKLGELTIKVLYVPGHTKGGAAYYIEEEKVVFSGDSLFYQSIGRTDFPDGSYPLLINSIKSQLFTLPSDTVVYPGHGPKTTIGYEKKYNPFLQE